MEENEKQSLIEKIRNAGYPVNTDVLRDLYDLIDFTEEERKMLGSAIDMFGRVTGQVQELILTAKRLDEEIREELWDGGF